MSMFSFIWSEVSDKWSDSWNEWCLAFWYSGQLKWSMEWNLRTNTLTGLLTLYFVPFAQNWFLRKMEKRSLSNLACGRSLVLSHRMVHMASPSVVFPSVQHSYECATWRWERNSNVIGNKWGWSLQIMRSQQKMAQESKEFASEKIDVIDPYSWGVTKVLWGVHRSEFSILIDWPHPKQWLPHPPLINYNKHI